VRTEHSLYSQEASRTRQEYRRKPALRDSAPETRTAVIFGRVSSGPSSPVAVSGPSSPDARYSDKLRRASSTKSGVQWLRRALYDVSLPVATVRLLDDVRRPVATASGHDEVSHTVATVRFDEVWHLVVTASPLDEVWLAAVAVSA
jgi:hypothetical protein